MREAWIDVGGTFTDCYVRFPDGRLERTKLLSTGSVPISIGADSMADQLQAPELQHDVDGFWVGAQVRIWEPDRSSARSAQVTAFAKGRLQLDKPIVELNQKCRAELDTGLEAPVLATRRLLGTPLQTALLPLRVRLGTTRGTNALLTRRGARTALAITAPLEDLLLIGDQTRPDLFALNIQRSAPLAEITIGIRERLDARGQIVQPLDNHQALHELRRARELGCESLAICLMHSYINPQHELQLLQLAREAGFEQVSCSSELAPLIEIVPRAQTAVVDAYLSPIVRSYLQRLVTQFGGADAVQLLVMTSGGGLVDWQKYFGKDSILSGPAGGVAALRYIARTLRPGSTSAVNAELIGLDMGGTSTDVCRVSSDHNLQYESTKAGVRIFTPTLPIETVAAGGGSVCWFDGVSLRVGPQSAGASPGPACYGRGGPLTITDLNVYLGRIPVTQFPFPMDHQAITVRLSEILQETNNALGLRDATELAKGFRRIANEQMSAAVRTVSLAQGVDPRSQILIGFGGAAGQHICEIAEILGIQRIVDTAEAGLLSALGMGLAERRLDAVVSVYQRLDEVNWEQLDLRAADATGGLIHNFHQQGIAVEEVTVVRWLEMRYAKTEASLTLAWPERLGVQEELKREFAVQHRRRYGYSRPMETPLELVSVRIEVTTSPSGAVQIDTLPRKIAQGVPVSPPQAELGAVGAAPSTSGGWSHIERQELRAGEPLVGPAIVLNAGSTLVVDRGWQAVCGDDGLLTLEMQAARSEAAASQLTSPKAQTHTTWGNSTDPFDPIFRDCLAQRLSAIATQMGIVLQHTAVSVNVKQRRDYSCAIFDAEGCLLANAPHVPVHLGAMGETVRAVRAEFPKPEPGDSFVTNDPYRGGSHLPDVTVVTPVFSEQPDRRLAFYVANRAHHADIGGVAPGSMSVAATRLGDEGVVIPPMRLTTADGDCTTELLELLRHSAYPPRNLAENLADLTAQLAANARGVELLSEYAALATWEELRRYSGYVLDAAELRVRNFLRANPCPLSRFSDYLDDGTRLQVSIASRAEGELLIDFTGSGPTSRFNFNANRSIVTAAVIYVLRCWIADDLPLNEGVMRCVELITERGILDPQAAIPAADSPAMAAGNVETSQRIVDVLLGALGLAAASQGTMNNLLFGNQRFGFYETICGGAGATSSRDGASGVHTHMTNTRLTDPEVLEARYPVRLMDFGLRPGSGGRGAHCGGQGVIRRLQFLEQVELSLLTSRRGPYAPFGLAGGQAGSLGYNTLVRTDGSRTSLPSCCQITVAAGEQIELLTPGGGGFGRE
jgi:5-oxoprolinase (ATP-hydrolysing)